MSKVALFSRIVLISSSAGALLSACGGSQPPIGARDSVAQSAAIATLHTKVHGVPPGSSYRVVYRFGGRFGDAEGPWAPLTEVNGTLYGTTFLGGDSGLGAVYSVSTSGEEAVLHSFGGKSDGNFPKAGLVQVDGTLYGTTYSGGASDRGTVYSVSQSGTEKVLHSFGGGSDGAGAYSGLLNVRGSLFGTTYFDGGSGCHAGCGTVYSVNSTSGEETVVHSFGGPPDDGAKSQASLLSANGGLYGTTVGGGSLDKGTVYIIRPVGEKEGVVHSFGGGSDGAHPYAGLISVDGSLYGTTYEGGSSNLGTVYSINKNGTESVLYSFKGPDGAHPRSGLILVRGALYGTTAGGGSSGYGTIYSITTSGTETVLHSFGGVPDGALPIAGRLINVNGTLYGTTYGGGKSPSICADGTGCGTVFALTP
jgi:uncharacterized repeat protein (TIGR03803 family)